MECAILECIKNAIKSNEKLHYCIRCVRNYKNTMFRKRVLEINNNNNILTIRNNGNLNLGMSIYYIRFDEMGNGFFAEYRKLLNALYFADLHGLKPVVEYAQTFAYAECNGMKGIVNPFEYYYKQPANITLEEANESATVLYYQEENRLVAEQLKEENGYQITARYEEEMARIIRKYVRYTEEVEQQLQQEICKLLGDDSVLAVHVRGTDFKNGFNRHPNYVTIDEYIEHVQVILEADNQFTKIFLATDDLNAIDEFKQRFGDKVICYDDVTRSSGDESVMLSEDNRQYHKYKLGYEVIRDMQTLSLCDGLVAGMSQVSIIARITKKSMGDEYRMLDIIDKGIASNNNSYITSYNRTIKNQKNKG